MLLKKAAQLDEEDEDERDAKWNLELGYFFDCLKSWFINLLYIRILLEKYVNETPLITA